MNRARKFLNEGNLDEALLEFNRAVENDNENYEAHFNLAQLYLKKDVLLKSEEHFKKVVDINKYNQEIEKLNVLQQLGEIQFNLNKLEDSYYTYKKILTIYANDYKANYYTGIIYAGQLIYEDAIDYFRKAIRARPNDINARINAALCIVQMDNIDNAINMLQETIKLASDNLIAKYYIGVLFFQGKSYKKAIEFLLEILKKTDDNKQKYYCYRFITLAYFFLGRTDELHELMDAGINFVKLNNMIEEYKQLLYDYGMIYTLRNDWSSARDKLIMVETLDNYFEYVEDLMTYVNYKQLKEDEDEDEVVEEYSPAMASYYKAAQHVMGLKEDDNETEKMVKIIKDIKDDWMESFIPVNFLWKDSSLVTTKAFNLEILTGKEKLENIQEEAKKITSTSFIRDFMKLDRKVFKEVSRKIVTKMGLEVIKENFKTDLADFVEGDGIDYVCKQPVQDVVTLVQIRRWDQGKVGEIPLRNMTHQMAVEKAKRGFFIVPAELTPGAQKFLEQRQDITFYAYSEMSRLLRSVMT